VSGREKTNELTQALSAKHGGKHEDVAVQTGLFKICRHLIKTHYRQMRLKLFVRSPVVEIRVGKGHLVVTGAQFLLHNIGAPFEKIAERLDVVAGLFARNKKEGPRRNCFPCCYAFCWRPVVPAAAGPRSRTGRLSSSRYAPRIIRGTLNIRRIPSGRCREMSIC